jgi:hypothetical protein
MLFSFRTYISVWAAPAQRPCIGLRAAALHASAVAEAAEHFLHGQLQRKREKVFANAEARDQEKHMVRAAA